MTRARRLTVLLLASSLGAAAQAFAADQLDGESLYRDRGCVYCHGAEGKDPALTEYPKLAGQNEQYLLQQMIDIRTTSRKNGYTGMMQPAVANISDEEFAAIAAYLATL